jgi:PAS domain-containing protein
VFDFSLLDDITLDCRRPLRPFEIFLACLRANGTLELITGAWEGFLGYSRAELDGSSLYDLLAPEGDAARALVRALGDPRQPEPVLLEVRERAGAVKRLRVYRRFDEYEPSVYLACEPFVAPMSRASRSTPSLSTA